MGSPLVEWVFRLGRYVDRVAHRVNGERIPRDLWGRCDFLRASPGRQPGNDA